MTSVKTFTFAIVHFTVAFSVGYILTGSIAMGSLLAIVEPAVNTVAFFFHERAWQQIEHKRQVKAYGEDAHMPGQIAL